MYFLFHKETSLLVQAEPMESFECLMAWPWQLSCCSQAIETIWGCVIGLLRGWGDLAIGALSGLNTLVTRVVALQIEWIIQDDKGTTKENIFKKQKILVFNRKSGFWKAGSRAFSSTLNSLTLGNLVSLLSLSLDCKQTISLLWIS